MDLYFTFKFCDCLDQFSSFLNDYAISNQSQFWGMIFAIHDAQELFVFWHMLNDVSSCDYITKSKLSLSRPKMAQFVEMSFIVFRLASLISTGKTNYLDETHNVTVFLVSYLWRCGIGIL